MWTEETQTQIDTWFTKAICTNPGIRWILSSLLHPEQQTCGQCTDRARTTGCFGPNHIERHPQQEEKSKPSRESSFLVQNQSCWPLGTLCSSKCQISRWKNRCGQSPEKRNEPKERRMGVLHEDCSVFVFWATPAAYSDPQARGWTEATAAGLHHSHIHAGSEPRLWPTPQFTATLDP